MSKKIVSTTLAIGIDFIAGSSVSSSYIVSAPIGAPINYQPRSIFVPFLVDEIIVKSIDAHFGADIGLVNCSSSLVNGRTLHPKFDTPPNLLGQGRAGRKPAGRNNYENSEMGKKYRTTQLEAL